MSGQAVSSFEVPSATKEQSPRKQPTILLADDHKMVLEHVLPLLQNFQVVGTVGNGMDLVTEALRLQPEVIVLDITMPRLNGIEAAHEIREAGSTSKFVFLTVHEQPAFLEACFAEGALGYVTKSRLGTDLLPAINEALSGHRFVSSCLPR